MEPATHHASLEIVVNGDIRLRLDDTPKKLVEGIKRQLRQQGVSSRGEAFSLFKEKDGFIHLPQGLLATVIEQCQKQLISYSIVDQRPQSSCSSLRPASTLSSEQQNALHKLLLKGGGVVVAPELNDQFQIISHLVSKRQTRVLVATKTQRAADAAQKIIQRSLSAALEDISTLPEGLRSAHVAVGTYAQILELPKPKLRQFGLLVLSNLETIDPISTLRVARLVAARFVVGLSTRPTRPDQIENALFLALGGLTTTINPQQSLKRARLKLQEATTSFAFPYKGRENYQALLATLAKDAVRNQQLKQDILDASAAGHRCIVLSERKDQLQQLDYALADHLTIRRIDSSFRPAERIKQVAEFNNETQSVLLATGQIIADMEEQISGTALFLCFPFSYAKKLESIIAGCLRTNSPQQQCIVYDYDDPAIDTLHRAFDKRRKVLKRIQSLAETEYKQWAQLKLTM